MRDILKRLKKLEEMSPDGLVISVNDEGTEKQCSVKEFEENPHYVFIRVIKGNSVKDVDKIISHIDALAKK